MQGVARQLMRSFPVLELWRAVKRFTARQVFFFEPSCPRFFRGFVLSFCFSIGRIPYRNPLSGECTIKPHEFDFVILGGGAAGLSLAYHLVQSRLQGARILIVDKEAKTQNDRTWCFWSRKPTPFTSIYFRSWSKLRFIGENFSRVLELEDYAYHMVRGIDYYQFVWATLKKFSNVVSLIGEVEALYQDAEGVDVLVSGQTLRAQWVFDSIFNPDNFIRQTERYHYLLQHFKGWEIESEIPVFDPQEATLFDFRIPQGKAMQFMYVLPFAPQRALVEYTLFSPSLLSDEAYDAVLRDYIGGTLGIKNYRISHQEKGVIPMTDQPFPRRIGERVLTIGTKGGRVKPSSGYAFLRIHADSAAIVDSLERWGDPFHLPRAPRRFQFFDRLMLQVMYREGERMNVIFTDLFRNNPASRIFRFLDEQAGWRECLQVLASLPPQPFLRALWRVGVLRRL